MVINVLSAINLISQDIDLCHLNISLDIIIYSFLHAVKRERFAGTVTLDRPWSEALVDSSSAAYRSLENDICVAVGFMTSSRFLHCLSSLQWRHNGHNGVSNHQPRHCLLNRLSRRRSKKTSKPRHWPFCGGIHRWPVNSPHKWPVTRKMFSFDDVIMFVRGTGGFPPQCTNLVPVASCLKLLGMGWYNINPLTTGLTHWPLGDLNKNLGKQFSS